MCHYDELFAYGQQFDLAHLLGCGNVIATRLNGVTSGLVHWLAEAGMIFLAPLIVIGLWRERRARLFQAALWYAALLFAAMTLVFTFAGDRGGLFHSTGALLPFFYAAAPLGLDAAHRLDRAAAAHVECCDSQASVWRGLGRVCDWVEFLRLSRARHRPGLERSDLESSRSGVRNDRAVAARSGRASIRS